MCSFGVLGVRMSINFRTCPVAYKTAAVPRLSAKCDLFAELFGSGLRLVCC